MEKENGCVLTKRSHLEEYDYFASVLAGESILSIFSAFGITRLASQGRDCVSPSLSNSILPLMTSLLTLPEYFEVMVLPPNSRVTVKETSPPAILPSLISVSTISPPRRGEDTVPVTFSPSTLRTSLLVRSGPPLRPGTLQVQMPVASGFFSSAWASAAKATAAQVNSLSTLLNLV